MSVEAAPRWETLHCIPSAIAKGPGSSTSARLLQTPSTITITVERHRGQ